MLGFSNSKFPEFDLKFVSNFNTRSKALDEIYKIYIFLHRSDLNTSAKIGKMPRRIWNLGEFGNYLLANFGFDTAEKEPSKVCRIPRRLRSRGSQSSGASIAKGG